MKPRNFVAAFTFAALSCAAGMASADDDPSAIAAARVVGLEGLRLAEAGNCNDAIDKLDRAERLHHAPTTLGRLGECNVQTGHLVLGVEQLRRLTRETIAAGAPAAFVAAKARAQKVLDQASPRIAQLRVTVTLPAGAERQVTIDGEAIPAALLDLDRPTDPGSHAIEATAPGYKKTTQSILLKDGEKLAITLSPEAEPVAVAPPPTPPPAAPAPIVTEPPAAPPPRSNALRTVGWTLVGVGAAGVVTGAIAGALGLGTKSDLNSSCDAQKRCSPGQQDNIDKLKTEATVGTIGFVVGGVGLVSGALILLFGPKAAHVEVGLGTIRYGGAF